MKITGKQNARYRAPSLPALAPYTFAVRCRPDRLRKLNSESRPRRARASASKDSSDNRVFPATPSQRATLCAADAEDAFHPLAVPISDADAIPACQPIGDVR
jgi:hypothetical protein